VDIICDQIIRPGCEAHFVTPYFADPPDALVVARFEGNSTCCYS